MVATLVALGAVGACRIVEQIGRPDGGELGEVAVAPTAVDLHCRELAIARCQRELGCQTLDSSRYGACANSLQAACAEQSSRVAAGLLTFDAAAAAACRGDVPEHPCIVGAGTLPESCAFARLFRPGAAIGARCSAGEDCTEGFCFGEPGACKSCRPFAHPGELCECTGGEACAMARRCDPAQAFCPALPPDGGSAPGTPRRCEDLRADGQLCFAASECQSRLCPRAGTDPIADRVCGALPEGASCLEEEACGPEAYCAGLRPELAGSCSARIPRGGSCVDEELDDGCLERADVCLAGICQQPPHFALTEEALCAGDFQCQDHLYCPSEGAPRRCRARLPVGTPCRGEDFGACSDGTRCDATSYCRALGGPDAPCGYPSECRLYLDCPPSGSPGAGSCTPFQTEGGPCGPSGVTCERSVCAREGDSFSCVFPRSLDEHCELNAECDSRRCWGLTVSDQRCLPACF